MVTEEDLKGYVECLVRNLKNINNPEKFHPEMVFRDGPKMAITIMEGKMFIEAEFNYIYHAKKATIPLSFGSNKFAEIDQRGIDLFIQNEEATVNAITRRLYQLFNNCNC